MRCETFGQTIQITMKYNERDVSDDEQRVEGNEHDEDNEDEEPEDESEDEDEEQNPWVGIQNEVEERQKEKLQP